MEKIDNRHHYIVVLDTETANSNSEEGLVPSNSMVYDCGWLVTDTKGRIYETASYVNADIYCNYKEMMNSAYYSDKLPQYEEDLKNGKRKLATFNTIRKDLYETCRKYNVMAISAHNARFDYSALTSTQRYLTKSKYRYFFPYGVEIWDTLKMARDVICTMPTYEQYCWDFGYLTKNGKPRATAEILYRFISGNEDFIESHTGLEDCEIEKDILIYCLQKNPPRKKLWEN